MPKTIASAMREGSNRWGIVFATLRSLPNGKLYSTTEIEELLRRRGVNVAMTSANMGPDTRRRVVPYRDYLAVHSLIWGNEKTIAEYRAAKRSVK